MLYSIKIRTTPDKTFVGRIEKGFDSLGYHFSRQALSLANQTIQHFRENLQRLYEQQQTAPERAELLVEYVIRWLRRSFFM